jgi:hypothetical protein
VIWWFILYWPVMGTLIFVGNQLSNRYEPNSVERGRAEMALGCGVIAMPVVPLIIFFAHLALG